MPISRGAEMPNSYNHGSQMKLYSNLLVIFLVVCNGFLRTMYARQCSQRYKVAAAYEDYMVLGTALKDLSSRTDIVGLRSQNQKATLIVLAVNTVGESGMLDENQISSELKQDGFHISKDIGVSLRNRNIKVVSWRGMRQRTKFVAVEDLSKYPHGFAGEYWKAIQERYPNAKADVEAWLPGYSKDCTQAVVRFWFGPTAHGATATYMLIRQNKQWKIKWHEISYYA